MGGSVRKGVKGSWRVHGGRGRCQGIGEGYRRIIEGGRGKVSGYVGWMSVTCLLQKHLNMARFFDS